MATVVMSKLARSVIALFAAGLLLVSANGYAGTVEESPSAAAMTGDALFARPLLLATTIVGAAVFVVSLPFSALGGNVGEAGDTLVVQPAKATFVRCLGCTTIGRKDETIGKDAE